MPRIVLRLLRGMAAACGPWACGAQHRTSAGARRERRGACIGIAMAVALSKYN